MVPPLRVAALVKQIPKFENLTLGPDGRLERAGLELHLNDYCRRAVAKGVELADLTGGTCVVITLGPPSADTVLREAILCGADHGIHVTDPAFAGSDTLATAKALAAALRASGPFDLVLCGRNSLDADTGQVPPEVAQLLDLPFLTGARELELLDGVIRARLEHDDEWVEAEVTLPAIISCAERLIDPCKIKDPVQWATVDAARIHRVTAADLGPGPWGQAASPTWVGTTRSLAVSRAREIVGQVDEAVERIIARGALDREGPPVVGVVPTPTGSATIAVLVEPDRPRSTRELIGAAADLAHQIGARVEAIGPAPGAPDELASWGADTIVTVAGSDVEEDIAAATAGHLAAIAPWTVLAPSTAWGREVAARVAAALDCGLTGDAVELDVDEGRLVAWKPAFGGALVAAVGCSSAVQMVTVRAGVLPCLTPRDGAAAAASELPAPARGRVTVHRRVREDDSEEQANADIVIGIGNGVDPADYELLRAMADRLGASMCATRKVTDKGWMPRARQVGITGHAISPRLYIGVGLSGKFNHTAGVRSAGTIVGINTDPDAELWRWSDVGLVGDWKELLPQLVAGLVAARDRSNQS